MPNVAQIGKNYENSIRNRIKKKWTTNITSSAGFGHGPDLVIPFPNNPSKKILVEIKTSTGADFGQKAITFDGTDWVAKHSDDETEEIIDLYNHLYSTYALSDKIKQSWNLPNNTFTSNDLVEMIETNQFTKVLGYEKMIIESTGKRNPFPQVTLENGKKIINAIVDYYNSKNIYYIQIKDSGFYILGNDKLNLNTKLNISIPKFNPSYASIVLRGKTSASNRTFRPTLSLKSSNLTTSSKYSLDDDKFIERMFNKLL